MSDTQFRNHTFFIRSTAHWLLDGNDYECDDEDRTYAEPTAPMGHWFIYAR